MGSDRPRIREVAAGLALLLAVMEFVDAFSIEETVFGIVMALVFAGLAFALWRTAKRWPAIVLAVLAALEFAMVVFVYPNSDDQPETWNTVVFAVVTFAVAVTAALGARRSAASAV